VLRDFDFYLQTSFHPICYKYVGIPGPAIIPVAAEDYFLTVRTEHWKCVETIVTADPLKVFALGVHDI
jgi:hypothetical protein